MWSSLRGDVRYAATRAAAQTPTMVRIAGASLPRIAASAAAHATSSATWVGVATARISPGRSRRRVPTHSGERTLRYPWTPWSVAATRQQATDPTVAAATASAARRDAVHHVAIARAVASATPSFLVVARIAHAAAAVIHAPRFLGGMRSSAATPALIPKAINGSAYPE